MTRELSDPAAGGTSMKMRTTSGSKWFVLAVGAVAIIASACGKQPSRTAATNEADSIAKALAADSLLLATAQRGREAYLGSCAMCHGAYGEGNGPMAAQVETQGKPPAALNNPILLDSLGRDEVVRIITRGGAQSHLSNLMPSWGEKLGPEVIGQIADYVMVLPRLKPAISRAAVEQYLAAPAGAPENGRKLFVYYCTVCHGAQGEGNGLLADTLWVNHQVRPRNLTDTAYMTEKTDRDLYMTIALGGDHVGKSGLMPAWGGVKISPNEVKDLVSYVRAISKTPSRP
jgi:cbb3-type cytochrome c oxidase subunit III